MSIQSEITILDLHGAKIDEMLIFAN